MLIVGELKIIKVLSVDEIWPFLWYGNKSNCSYDVQILVKIINLQGSYKTLLLILFLLFVPLKVKNISTDPLSIKVYHWWLFEFLLNRFKRVLYFTFVIFMDPLDQCFSIGGPRRSFYVGHQTFIILVKA